jgi:hypothetical protein
MSNSMSAVHAARRVSLLCKQADEDSRAVIGQLIGRKDVQAGTQNPYAPKQSFLAGLEPAPDIAPTYLTAPEGSPDFRRDLAGIKAPLAPVENRSDRDLNKSMQKREIAAGDAGKGIVTPMREDGKELASAERAAQRNAKSEGSPAAGLPLSGMGELIEKFRASKLGQAAEANPGTTVALAAGVPAAAAVLYYALQQRKARKKPARMPESLSGSYQTA